MLPAAALRQHAPRQALGHATVSITMDVYAHVLKDQENDAAQRIGGALYGTEGSR